jgi:hypothetical protein
MHPVGRTARVEQPLIGGGRGDGLAAEDHRTLAPSARRLIGLHPNTVAMDFPGDIYGFVNL